MKTELLLVGATLLLASCAPAPTPTAEPAVAPPLEATATPQPTATLPPEPTPEPVPPEVADHADQWPLPNKDYASTRADLDAEISSQNVGELGVSWSFEFDRTSPFGFGAATTNPLIIDGEVYLQDLASNVYALDLMTGELLWDRRYERSTLGPNGVAVGWGKLFATGGQTTVVAVDIVTGEELWSVDLTQTPEETIFIQPLAYDGLVYVSTVVSGDGPGAGVISALDQATGEVRWSFNTIDSQDVWGNPEVNGGGGAWYPPSIDIGRGMTYWGIADPKPHPGTEEFPSGSSRPGPNLYTNSVVALDHRSGRLEWYNQVQPHDLFNRDFVLSPILTTATIEGVERDIVIGSGKTGTVHAFDADTGEELWETPVGLHENDDLEAIPEGETVYVSPGGFGGVLTPMAYADGTVYLAVVNVRNPFTPTDGGGIGDVDFEGATGEFLAVEVESGEVLWSREFDSMLLGGATVVNDLVFTATFDGVIYALDRGTGDEIWSYQAPAGINGWPAVARDMIVFPAGVQLVPGGSLSLLAFRLGA